MTNSHLIFLLSQDVTIEQIALTHPIDRRAIYKRLEILRKRHNVKTNIALVVTYLEKGLIKKNE